MKSILFTAALLASLSAHAAVSANCLVTAVLDGALPLAHGESVTISDSKAVIGSTIVNDATIVEHTNGSLRAVRVIDQGTTIEVISDTRTNEGALYVTALSGPTVKVALLHCR